MHPRGLGARVGHVRRRCEPHVLSAGPGQRGAQVRARGRRVHEHERGHVRRRVPQRPLSRPGQFQVLRAVVRGGAATVCAGHVHERGGGAAGAGRVAVHCDLEAAGRAHGLAGHRARQHGREEQVLADQHDDVRVPAAGAAVAQGLDADGGGVPGGDQARARCAGGATVDRAARVGGAGRAVGGGRAARAGRRRACRGAQGGAQGH
mmetsp:Transcript_22079/g.71072  ORF Transcript_22079/g.71072 Transcript_22079/m.71072 type:complete len:206 (+) Transcript_22079:179-796(+)